MFGKKESEWVPNTDRLVRSAMTQEVYCAYILDCLHETQVGWSINELHNFWDRASKSDLTVAEFINKERKQ